MTDLDVITKKVEDQRLQIIQLQQTPAGGAPRAGTSTTASSGETRQSMQNFTPSFVELKGW
eukprot:7839954-Pyramimonas_sp.AAC.1